MFHISVKFYVVTFHIGPKVNQYFVCELACTEFNCTGGPHYMRSFYLRIRVYVIENHPFLKNISTNL